MKYERKISKEDVKKLFAEYEETKDRELRDQIIENYYLMSSEIMKKVYSHEEVIYYLVNYLSTWFYPIFIPAPQLNERIIAQQGLFQIIPGLSIKQKTVIGKTTFLNKDFNPVRIPKEDKPMLLKELNELFNINNNTLKLSSKQDVVKKGYLFKELNIFD